MTVNGAHERAGDALLVRVWNRPHRLWVRVSGEVDLSNWEQLRAGLSQADPRSHGLVHLDLSELLFCDARGCQCLLDFEQSVRLAGNQPLIHGARPSIRKVMRLLEPDTEFTFL